MRLRFRLGDQVYPVDLARDADGRMRLTAAGASVTGSPDPAAPGELRLEVAGRVVRAVVARDGRRWWVAAAGEVVVLEETDDADVPRPSGHTAREVLSPIPGRVVKVLVAEGDVVEPGQVVVTVEAMKTENALRAEGAGRVTRLLVEPGDRVEPGQRLVELEPGASA